MPRSALWTLVEADELSFVEFGSGELPEMVAVFVKVVNSGVVLGTCTVRVNWADRPLAKEAKVHVTVPFVPTAGVEQLNVGPVFCTRETKVTPAGSGSVMLTLVAESGPAFDPVSV